MGFEELLDKVKTRLAVYERINNIIGDRDIVITKVIVPERLYRSVTSQQKALFNYETGLDFDEYIEVGEYLTLEYILIRETLLDRGGSNGEETTNKDNQ